jgi:N6-L-threonylcarbamoyladenine synthase
VARILAIESSCDETAAAVLEDGSHVLANVVASQLALHAKYGGVVPELASREHLRSIVPVVREALEKAGLEWKDLSAVAATSGPGLAGALLVGLTYAKAISFATGVPLIAVHHIEGHIQSVMLEARQRGMAVELPALALVASGGHTHMYEVRDSGYRLLGKTRDDAAGEAFDKVAKLLGFGYPGGPVIDRLAPYGDPHAVPFTPARVKGSPLDFSFSGLKTAVLRWVESHDLATEIEVRKQLLRRDPQPSLEAWLGVTPQATRDLLASFQHSVIGELLGHAAAAAAQMEDVRSLVITGGVACNSGLRAAAGKLWAGLPVYFPTPALSTDNAVMIAAAAWAKFERGEFALLTEMARPNAALA